MMGVIGRGHSHALRVWRTGLFVCCRRAVSDPVLGRSSAFRIGIIRVFMVDYLLSGWQGGGGRGGEGEGGGGVRGGLGNPPGGEVRGGGGFPWGLWPPVR